MAEMTTAEALVAFAQELSASEAIGEQFVGQLVLAAGRDMIQNHGLSVKRDD